MVKFLHSSDPHFKASLAAALATSSEYDPAINEAVAGIIADVRKRGDKALVEYTEKFDQALFKPAELRVTEEEINQAFDACDANIINTLELAAQRIADYHQKQMPEDASYTDAIGATLGWKWTAIDAVGLYVPGGSAAYPSSVLMNAIPATVAGVSRMAMVVPAPQGNIRNPLVLAAAKIAGVTEMFKVGGAQAVAALAYGTETIPAVDKIVGPGNAYVAAAKRQVFGKVGIDMIAGPSDILVIADNQNDPRWVAADLLSQAEHDAASRSVLITDDENFAGKVLEAAEAMLSTLARQDIARKSWEHNAITIISGSLEEAADIANIIAPEHLELAVENPEKLEKYINNAGAIFLGRYTPEAIGDYIAGPSHVLPTGGCARFSSGLGVFDFLKRTSLLSCSKKAFETLCDHTTRLAEEEGLGAHALSASIRMEE